MRVSPSPSYGSTSNPSCRKQPTVAAFHAPTPRVTEYEQTELALGSGPRKLRLPGVAHEVAQHITYLRRAALAGWLGYLRVADHATRLAPGEDGESSPQLLPFGSVAALPS